MYPYIYIYIYIYVSCVAHAQVSEWRHGEAAEAELAGTVVIKPFVGQGSQAQPSAQANSHAEAEEEEQEEEEEEGADLLQLHAALFHHCTICPIVMPGGCMYIKFAMIVHFFKYLGVRTPIPTLALTSSAVYT